MNQETLLKALVGLGFKERRAWVSTVITLADSLTLTIITAQKSEKNSIECIIAAGIMRTIIHDSDGPQTAQLPGQLFEQKNGELFEQKNTI